MTSSMLAPEKDELSADKASIIPGGIRLTYRDGRPYIGCVCEVPAGARVSLSISGKEWKFPPEIQVDEKLLQAAGGSLLIAKLLVRRGIKTAAQAEPFLDPQYYTPASPMELPDVAKAIVRISQAIAEKERITVYGDYDVDGVTGTSVLVSVLRHLGADVDYYVPNRTGEGYGLNLKAVSILASKRRTKLIVTCDCGVSNFAEVNFAKSLGVDTIITDHHTMPEMLPPAVAVLHPKRLSEEHPLYDLPGVGVAYKLCEALLTDRGNPGEADKLLDFVTLGMIADLVPLIRENRYLVQIGLPKLVSSPRPGLKALLSQVKSSGDTDLVGFGLAPRINAVGRLSDANLAVELMTTDDSALAEKLAHQLQTENSRRQELCDRILLEADQLLADKGSVSADRAIAIYKEGWHHGVVGIVASRLVEKHHKPVFIGELDREDGTLKGSARGVDGIDLYQALKANEHLLSRWGGHKMAAGFSVEADKAEAFCRAITDTCNRMLAEKAMRPVLDIDALVDSAQVSMDLVRELSRLAPFGMSNKKPLLAIKGLVCVGTRALGKEGKHSRIMLKDPASAQVFESVMWNSKGRVPVDGSSIDVAFNAEINSYNGNDRLQLVLADWLDRANNSGGKNVAQTILSAPATASAPAERVSAPARSGTGSQSGVNLTAKPAAQAAVPEPPGVTAQAGASSQSAIVAAPEAVVSVPPPVVRSGGLASTSLVWKDLRDHASPNSLLEAAVRKLGGKLCVFGETPPRIPGVGFVDRTTIADCRYLMLWQFPPSAQIFKSLLVKSGATNIYMIRTEAPQKEDGAVFLRRLVGLVRFAVNQREGKADSEKLGAAMGTTSMAMALGLAILRKLNVVDFFAEDGWLYLDLLGDPAGTAEALPEYRQLANSLKEIHEFRVWCAEGSLKEIQLAVTPNHIDFATPAGLSRRADELDQFEDTAGIGSEESVQSTSA